MWVILANYDAEMAYDDYFIEVVLQTQCIILAICVSHCHNSDIPKLCPDRK